MPTSAPRPAITGISLLRYRAFQQADIDLGRLTLILGRNNAGKSALCFSALHFAQAFAPGAQAPLVSANSAFGFGSPQSAIFLRQPSGTQVQLRLDGAGPVSSVTLGVAVIEEHNHAQQVTIFQTTESGNGALDLRMVDWQEVQSHITDRPALAALAGEVGGLRGVRPMPPREMDYLGYTPTEVGFHGSNAAMMLLASGEQGLAAVNRWFSSMRVRIDFKRHQDTFEVRAYWTAGASVNLAPINNDDSLTGCPAGWGEWAVRTTG